MKTARSCRFCWKDAILCESHIIPEYFFDYDSLHRFLQITGGHKPPRIEQKGTRYHLLCITCEGCFNNHFDLPMKRQWMDQPRLPDHLPPSHLRVAGLEYASFKLFHLSVLWRAHAAGHHHVNLGPHEARIKRMLADQDPGRADQYPIFASALRLPDNTPATGIVMLPATHRIDAYHVYVSIFGGCVWHCVVANHPIARERQQHALTTGGELTIIVDDWRNNATLDRILSAFERLHAEAAVLKRWPR